MVKGPLRKTILILPHEIPIGTVLGIEEKAFHRLLVLASSQQTDPATQIKPCTTLTNVLHTITSQQLLEAMI